MVSCGSEVPAWPWRQLEGWTPSLLSVSHPSLVSPEHPRGQSRTPGFSFLAFSSVLRIYQVIMYIRPVLYMSYIPSPCKTCSFSKNINKIMYDIYMYVIIYYCVCDVCV